MELAQQEQILHQGRPPGPRARDGTGALEPLRAARGPPGRHGDLMYEPQETTASLPRHRRRRLPRLAPRGRGPESCLKERGVTDIIVPRRKDYDLTHEADVVRLYENHKPEVVFHLAAEVGGIGANQKHPGRFFFANAAMGLHLIEEGRVHGVERFVQTGTICAYPKFAPVPFREEDVWNGYPEETNAPYGIAKKSLQVMLSGLPRSNTASTPSTRRCPVNLYGTGDNFHPQTSHVIPALIRKMRRGRNAKATEVHIEAWGTGKASREFLYVDDCAEGIVLAAEKYNDPEPINLSAGREITIKDLTELVAKLSGFTGKIKWDPTKPDGQPRRCLDTNKAREELRFRRGHSPWKTA